MKRVIIIALIALIVPACLFAGRGLVDLTIGATASTTYTIKDIQDGKLADFKFENLTFGADAELKMAFVAIDTRAIYVPETKSVYGMVSANLAVDIIIARLKAGLGYRYNYNIDKDILTYGVNGVSKVDGFKDAYFDINVGLDFLLGNLTIGAYATLPTSTSIKNGDWSGLYTKISDHWSNALLGITVGIDLI
ncbi:MAG: hypothetical protein ACTTJW_01475 [Sphaerochaeta sp.]